MTVAGDLLAQVVDQCIEEIERVPGVKSVIYSDLQFIVWTEGTPDLLLVKRVVSAIWKHIKIRVGLRSLSVIAPNVFKINLKYTVGLSRHLIHYSVKLWARKISRMEATMIYRMTHPPRLVLHDVLEMPETVSVAGNVKADFIEPPLDFLERTDDNVFGSVIVNVPRGLTAGEYRKLLEEAARVLAIGGTLVVRTAKNLPEIPNMAEVGAVVLVFRDDIVLLQFLTKNRKVPERENGGSGDGKEGVGENAG